jgi:putative ABC transport system permease protein
MLTGLGDDLRYAMRGMARAPGASAVIIVTLALVIGSNAAAFSVVWGGLARPIQVANLDRIVGVSAPTEGDKAPGITWAVFAHWRQHSQSFEALAASTVDHVVVTGPTGAVPSVAAWVNAEFFSVLRAQPVLGTTFDRRRADLQPGAQTVISEAWWGRRFGRDPALLGRTVRIGGRVLTVVGVMPQDFSYPLGTDLWIALDETSPSPPSRVRVLGLLRPEVDRRAVTAELQTLLDNCAGRAPSAPSAGVVALAARPLLNGDGTSTLSVVLPVLTLPLLFVGWANLAALLLGRAIHRRKEIAVRISVGGSRWRIIRQLLIESLTLSLLGSAAGLVVAEALWLWAGTFDAIAAVPGLRNAGLDGPALLCCVGLALISGVAFGLFPAVQLARTDLKRILDSEGQAHTGGRGIKWTRDLLIGFQVAVAVVTTFGTIWMTVSDEFIPGVWNPAAPEAAYAEVDQAGCACSSDQTIESFASAALSDAHQLPWVGSAALVYDLDKINDQASEEDVPAGETPVVGQDKEAVIAADALGRVYRYAVAGDLLAVLGIPLLAGRDLSPADGEEGAPAVVVVNEALARQLRARGDDPLQKTLRFGAGDSERNIVGIVGDAGHGIFARRASPTIYVPVGRAGPAPAAATLLVAGNQPAANLVAGLRDLVERVSPGRPVIQLGLLRDRVMAEVRQERTATGFFAVPITFLLIAAFGLAGVVSIEVGARKRELGVRMALGATPWGVMRAVVGRALLPLILGILTGSTLLGLTLVTRKSPVVELSLAAAMVLVVALLAALVPALAIARREPMRSLRPE